MTNLQNIKLFLSANRYIYTHYIRSLSLNTTDSESSSSSTEINLKIV